MQRTPKTLNSALTSAPNFLISPARACQLKSQLRVIIYSYLCARFAGVFAHFRRARYARNRERFSVTPTLCHATDRVTLQSSTSTVYSGSKRNRPRTWRMLLACNGNAMVLYIFLTNILTFLDNFRLIKLSRAQKVFAHTHTHEIYTRNILQNSAL